MRFLLPKIVLLAAALTIHVSAAACFAPPDAEPTSEEKWVELRTDLAEPHFYYRARHVVVFIPEAFVRDFRHKFTGKPMPVAQALMRAAPLDEHTDIYKAVILDSIRLTSVELIVAEALEAGLALVYSPQTGGFAPAVKVVTFNDVCSGGRRFHFQNGKRQDRIMERHDWIS